MRTQAHSRRQDGSLEVTNVTLKPAALACLLAGLAGSALAQAAAPAGPAESLYHQLQTVALDKARVYQVRDGAIDRSAAHFSLDDGTISFTADIDGRITGAFFRGDGEVLLTPPDATERRSLAFFTGTAILEEKFSTAYFRFNDDVPAELKNSLRPPEDPESFVSQWNTTAQNLAPEDALRLLTTFVNSPNGGGGDDRFLHAYLQGERLGTFDVRYDSLSPEHISAGEHRTVEGVDFYDVWTSFSPRTPASMAPGTPRIADFEITAFKINAQIRPPTQLDAQTTLMVVPHLDGKRLLLFELSRLLQIRQVKADGTPVEFIHNPSIEGSQLARQGNDVVAVILRSPTRAGQKVALAFDYGGSVLSEAANGLLYVGEHGTWYPNIGFEKASFDLEFRYPQGWTLVATGRRTKQATAGAEQVSQWSSERPIPVAGFNLGKYSQQETRAAGVSVLTYATGNVERGFPELTEVVPPPPGFLGSKPSLAMNPDPASPSPAGNAQSVGKAAARAVEFYQQRFGPFPYSQLSLTQFPGRISQGWPGLVFLASYAFLTPLERERFQPDAKLRLALEQTSAHEVAHQWWGDLVTWSGYRDQWVMEALANYSALMLLESRNPAAFHELLQKYRDDLLTKNHKGRQLAAAGPVTLGIRLSSSQFPNGYEAISYGRGTWLIHMLRCMMRDGERKSTGPQNVNDAAFLRALRKLRNEYETKPASTADLIRVFESELPSSLRYEGRKSLDWFYDGWVNGSSIPGYSLHDVKFTDHAAGMVATGVIVQEHAPDSLVSAVPIYAAVAGKNVFLARVFAEGGETQFRLSAPPGTRKLLVDPEQTLLSRK